MKNKKKLIGTINESPEFPEILDEIESVLIQEIGDYILTLNGTNYHDSISLLEILSPDILVLNLNLPARESIKIVDTYLENSQQTRLGIITDNAGVYYLSFCSTLSGYYFIDTSLDLELVASSVAHQQLN